MSIEAQGPTFQPPPFRPQGSYAANAVGFKVSDLSKLTDMRANKPQMTFLHYVILVAKSNNEHILDFTANSRTLKDALKVSLSSVEEDVTQMVRTVNRLTTELTHKSDAIKQVFSGKYPVWVFGRNY